MPRTSIRILAALGALAAAGLTVAAPAAAHTALVESSPAEGETVTALTEVELVFSEQLLDIGHEITLEGGDGAAVVLAIEAPVTESVTAMVPEGAIAAGPAVLRYRVVAGDGHPIEGTVGFTYAPAEPATASPSPDGATASAGPSASASPTPSASLRPRPPVDEQVGPNPAVYLIIGALAAAGLALTVAVRMHGGDA